MTNPTDSSAATTTTSTGLSANVAGALSYLLGFITGIVFLVLRSRTDSFASTRHSRSR